MKNMPPRLAWQPLSKLVLTLVAGVVLITGAGCQTCWLSEEDFEKQQRGEMVDKETGEVVGVVGTLGYYGYMLGAFIGAACRK